MNTEQAGLGLLPNTVLMDVRPLLTAGQDPFKEIMAGIQALSPAQGLAIRAPFEPAPLLKVLGSMGYSGRTRKLADDDWIVEFIPKNVLDVRGLEPPEPLARILAACGSLQAGGNLQVVHERRPQLLYARLESLGLSHQTVEEGEDLFRITITRKSEP